MNDDKLSKYLNKKKDIETIDKVLKKSLEDNKKKVLRDSEDGVMAYTTAHPHGGRGRIGRNKGITCPHCGRTFSWGE